MIMLPRARPLVLACVVGVAFGPLLLAVVVRGSDKHEWAAEIQYGMKLIEWEKWGGPYTWLWLLCALWLGGAGLLLGLRGVKSVYGTVVRAAARTWATALAGLAALRPARSVVGTDHDVGRELFCDSELLFQVQSSRLFRDSKEFVDMPLRDHPRAVLSRFRVLVASAGEAKVSRSQLMQFVRANFEAAGSDVLPWVPDDFPARAPDELTAAVVDPRLRKFAEEVHGVWRELGKAISPEVYRHPERHSLLPLKSRCTVVAGGRFREVYYWDSYWIVKGLLVSGMLRTALRLVDDLLDLVHRFGFVPNGGRKYYLLRSQPPLLTQMVDEVYSALCLSSAADLPSAERFLSGALPLLEREYAFWMSPGRHAVAVTCNCNCAHACPAAPGAGTTLTTGPVWRMHTGVVPRDAASGLGMEMETAADTETETETEVVVLNRYFADQAIPRPEAYAEDTETAASVATARERSFLFRQVAAAAESGWDFSSRWMADGCSLRSLITSWVLPADLNAIMYRNELVLARLHLCAASRELTSPLVAAPDAAGGHRYHLSRAESMLEAAARRHRAIRRLLWDASSWRWRDLVLSEAAEWGGTPGWSACSGVMNFLPLWAKLHLPPPDLSVVGASPPYRTVSSPPSAPPSVAPSVDGAAAAETSRRVLSALRASGLIMAGGVPVTVAARSSEPSGQQWDFPNVWAPLQHMLIEGLEYLADQQEQQPGDPDGPDLGEPGERGHSGDSCPARLAAQLAQAFVSTAFLAHSRTHRVFEKYDARFPGVGGVGGEYDPQWGFGWTNGVVLDLLRRYGRALRAPPILPTLELASPSPRSPTASGQLTSSSS